MKSAELSDVGQDRPVVVEGVAFDRPWEWLGAGWRDLWNRPAVSLFYGMFTAAGGIALGAWLYVSGLEALLPVLAGGFLLIGPLLAVGLYEKTRLILAGRNPTLSDTFASMRVALPRLGLVTAFLIFVYLVWMRIAFMLMALFLGTQGMPPARELMPTLLFTPHGLGMLVVGTAVGAFLAIVVFSMTAVAIPMLVDRHVDGMTAMVRSVEAVITNPKPMLLWAGLIAGFVALGIATLGVGLVIAFPLIGHATWHAYRDIIASGK